MSDHYTIRVPKDLLNRWLSCSAILLAPSKYEEGGLELYMTSMNPDYGPGYTKSDPILYDDEDRERMEKLQFLHNIVNDKLDSGDTN